MGSGVTKHTQTCEHWQLSNKTGHVLGRVLRLWHTPAERSDCELRQLRERVQDLHGKHGPKPYLRKIDAMFRSIQRESGHTRTLHCAFCALHTAHEWLGRNWFCLECGTEHR